MNFISKLQAKLGVMLAEKSNYTTLKIVSLKAMNQLELQSKWNDKSFEALIALCDYAREERHYFEELHILLDLTECFLKKSYAEAQLEQVKSRLHALEKVFDMPDSEFSEVYESTYLSSGNPTIIKQAEEYLTEWFKIFNRFADFMAANLHAELAFICGKALLKIAGLTDKINFERVIETYFMIGTYLADIQDIRTAIYYYKLALTKAREADDQTYQYIAIQRLLSFTVIGLHLEPTLNIDKERIEAMSAFFDLSDALNTTPYTAGKVLMAKEKQQAGEWTQFRCDRLSEAIPIMCLLLSLSRGDIETSRKYIQQLKESEMKAYGSTEGYSNADLLELVYLSMYESPDQEEEAEQSAVSEESPAKDDVELHADFPESMFPKDQFNNLMLYIRKTTSQNRYTGAESLCKQALTLSRKYASTYHEALSVFSIGHLYEHIRKTELAISHYKQALQILNSAQQNTGADMGGMLKYNILFNIGKLMTQSDPDAAIEYLTKALVCKDVPVLFQVKILLAQAEAHKVRQDWQERDKECRQALSLTFEEVKNRLPFVEGELRERLWKGVREIIEQVILIADTHCGGELITALYNAVLYAKGFLLSSECSMKKAVYAEPHLVGYIPLYEKIQAYNESKRMWGESTPDSAQDYMDHYTDEIRLLLAAKDYIGKYYDFLNTDYTSIRQTLAANDVVVEYFDHNNLSTRAYIAFVYRAGDEFPHIVRLCTEKELQQILEEIEDTYGKAFHPSLVYDVNLPYGHTLADLLWTPVQVEADISGTENVSFIPSGSIHKIAIESLPGGKDILYKTISEKFSKFQRLSSARQLCQSATRAFKDIVLFGGLDYGESPASEDPGRGYVMNQSDDCPVVLCPWSQLPMSAREVNQIAFLCNSINPGSAKKHMKTDGTVQVFLALSNQSPSVIHIASHGFCESKETACSIPGLKNKYLPMDLSGLVLSNGNKGWLNADMNREGILLASDISHMDLSDTQLVVLSACYTGSGRILSDGIYGLQRGLKKAGVKSIIMSLWNESDAMGCVFMSEFYKHLFGDTMNVNEAFRKTINEVRERYSDPTFWAGFILVD